MTSAQVRIDLPSLYGTQSSDSGALVARYSSRSNPFAVVFLVKNASAAQVRYDSPLESMVVYGTDALDVRPVTQREDRVLRRASLRSARVVHGGVLAAK